MRDARLPLARCREIGALLNPFDDQRAQVKAKTAVTYIVLVAANGAAWLWAWRALADQPALLGTALLAYMFGLRHAFDADHIAAIDNTVRKLVQDGKRPFAAGFFFSLGHSTVVVLASVAIAATAAAMKGQPGRFHDTLGFLGTAVSAVFLLAIGLANVFVLKAVWAAFKAARVGRTIAGDDIEALLAGRGLLARIFRPLSRMISHSWQMYPIGFLFGLGFDTATEIGLLGLSASQAAHGMSIWTILVFPALFTAGMSLMDTMDSTIMTGVYGWACIDPIRKLWYNLTITAASIAVAIFIGGIEALGLIGDKLALPGNVWAAIGNLNVDLTNFGFVVVGIFGSCWIVSAILYRQMDDDGLKVE